MVVALAGAFSVIVQLHRLIVYTALVMCSVLDIISVKCTATAHKGANNKRDSEVNTGDEYNTPTILMSWTNSTTPEF